MDAAKATKTNAAYGMGENLVLLFLHSGYTIVKIIHWSPQL